jgi:glycosyltransferase involved in cell wall biosynthesis
MAVLEALSVGRPVVILEDCGVASDVRDYGAGIVVDSTIQALTGAMVSLAKSPSLRASMGEQAVTLANERFSMGSVCIALEESYGSAG